MNSFEQKLDDIIALHLADLIKEKGLTQIAQFSEGLGALIDYQAPKFVLRVVNDRGDIFLSIRPNDQNERFEDLDLLCELLEPNAFDNLDSFDSKLPTEIGILRRHWDNIEVALSVESLPETKVKLGRIGWERVQVMFPEIKIPAPQ